MKKRFKISILLLSLVSICSCTVTNYYTYSLNREYSKEWKGATQKQIIDAYGAPDRIVNAGSGNRIIIYEDFTVKAFSATIGDYDIGKADKQRTFIEFYMDGYGKCYQVRTSDVGEYSKKEKASFGEWLNHGLQIKTYQNKC